RGLADPHQPQAVSNGRRDDFKGVAIELDRVAARRFGNLRASYIDEHRRQDRSAVAEADDLVGPPYGDTNSDARPHPARTPDRDAGNIRVGEQRIDRRSECVHHDSLVAGSNLDGEARSLVDRQWRGLSFDVDGATVQPRDLAGIDR